MIKLCAPFSEEVGEVDARPLVSSGPCAGQWALLFQLGRLDSPWGAEVASVVYEARAVVLLRSCQRWRP